MESRAGAQTDWSGGCQDVGFPCTALLGTFAGDRSKVAAHHMGAQMGSEPAAIGSRAA